MFLAPPPETIRLKKRINQHLYDHPPLGNRCLRSFLLDLNDEISAVRVGLLVQVRPRGHLREPDDATNISLEVLLRRNASRLHPRHAIHPSS